MIEVSSRSGVLDRIFLVFPASIVGYNVKKNKMQ